MDPQVDVRVRDGDKQSAAWACWDITSTGEFPPRSGARSRDIGVLVVWPNLAWPVSP